MARICAMHSSSLPEGEPKPLTWRGEQIMLVRYQGVAHAIGNVCSHSYALLTDGWYEDGCIECPLHQAAFDVRTGQPTCGPATEPVKSYPLVEEAGEIFIDL